MTSHLLLIDCPDQPGLVYTVTGALFRGGFNIVSNSEFVDRDRKWFFMRTEFAAAAGREATSDPQAVIDGIRPQMPAKALVRLADTGKRNVVLLATKESHCLGDLLLRHAAGELNAHILAVVSNYSTLGPLVEKFDLPFHHITHEGKSRPEHEAEILSTLREYRPEYIVLAKYMRVLTPEFVGQYPNRIINIHHSFLPAFVGASPYRQAFDRGVKIIGATAHFVNEDLDTGPIIAQGVLPVDHAYSAAGMAQAGRDVEKIVLAKALRLVFSERVFLSGHRTIIFES